MQWLHDINWYLYLAYGYASAVVVWISPYLALNGAIAMVLFPFILSDYARDEPHQIRTILNAPAANKLAFSLAWLVFAYIIWPLWLMISLASRK
jgi:hypothetical protein